MAVGLTKSLNNSPSVFLSFSGTDAKLAIDLREGLQDRGFDVWKAPESIPAGANWAEAIVSAIKQQQIFLLLWSDAAMASNEVAKEIALAAGRGRCLLLPVLLTSNEPPDEVAYHLAAVQRLDGHGLSFEELIECVDERLRDLIKKKKGSFWRGGRRPNVVLKRKALQFSALCFAFSAGAFDLNPWLAPNQWLLDQRLFWQVRWRQVTTQPGPTPEPIGLLPLTERFYNEFDVKPDDSVNQAILANILEALPASSAKTTGFDFILDGPGSNPIGHRHLAAVIKNQTNQRMVIAGLCPANADPDTDCLKATEQNLAILLESAGAKAALLGLGLNTTSQAPLQLQEGVPKQAFASSMALDLPKGLMPGNSVIDWSVDWLGPNRTIVIKNRPTLEKFVGNRLVVASNGYGGKSLTTKADQHPAPKAVLAYEDGRAQRLTSLQEGVLPGGAVQAVMAQSIRSGHWIRLIPFGQVLFTVLVGWLGWRAGRLRLKRRQTVLFWAVTVGVYTAIALQLLVSAQLLVPVLLPIGMATVLLRLKRLARPNS